MLKIYLRKLVYKVHCTDKAIKLKSYSDYTIKDEQEAISDTREFNLYVDKMPGCFYNIQQKKKGKLITFFEGDCTISFKEWKDPDAKLVISCSYEESQCSFKQLLNLPANDVIAYLKQEGLKLSTPS